MRKDEEVSRAISAYENAVASIDNARSSAENPSVETSYAKPKSAPTKSQSRGLRPYVGQREAITDYSERELISIFDWIDSDGRLRTNEEMIDEILPELGLHRRGAGIEAVLKSVLEKRRNRTNRPPV